MQIKQFLKEECGITTHFQSLYSNAELRIYIKDKLAADFITRRNSTFGMRALVSFAIAVALAIIIELYKFYN